MTRGWRRMTWRPVLGIAGAALCLGLAACSGGGAAPAPGAPSTPVNSSGWVTLNQDISVEQLPPLSPTTEPIAPKVMSPDEARSTAPFAFGVPAWVPAGFQLQAQAEVISPTSTVGYTSVNLDWQNAQGAVIELTVSHSEAGSSLLGGSGSAESLQVGGQPATLRHQTGFGADRLTLSWTRGSLAYRLTADADAATRDDLVRMAASVP
jgi:hypothetical protein